MDTTIISYFLTFCLTLILVVYLYQITDGNKLSKNTNILNKNSFIIDENIKPLKTIKNNTNCMPIHRVGPVYNFHQSFGKYKNIPEMAWRNFYLENYSNNHVVEEDPFSQIPTRHFLDNLKSVDNIYRQC